MSLKYVLRLADLKLEEFTVGIIPLIVQCPVDFGFNALRIHALVIKLHLIWRRYTRSAVLIEYLCSIVRVILCKANL